MVAIANKMYIKYTSIWINKCTAECTALYDGVSAIYVRSLHATFVKLTGKIQHTRSEICGQKERVV